MKGSEKFWESLEVLAPTHGSWGTALELVGLAALAGWGNATVTAHENGYWPGGESYYKIRSPWLRITTPQGQVRFGWRKRVIEIRWPDEWCIDGSRVVAANDFTHGDSFCHAWGERDAFISLQRLHSLRMEVAA